MRDVVVCSDARNFDSENVHPEACERVCDCGNDGRFHGLFGILRVVRNHRQPGNRHGDGNLENIPELERGGGSSRCSCSGGACDRA